MSEKEQSAVKIPTLKVTEAVDRLRKLGVKTSPMKLMAGIKQGVYPFGVYIAMNRCEYEIYEVKFNEWIAERMSSANEIR